MGGRDAKKNRRRVVVRGEGARGGVSGENRPSGVAGERERESGVRKEK